MRRQKSHKHGIEPDSNPEPSERLRVLNTIRPLLDQRILLFSSFETISKLHSPQDARGIDS